MTEAQADGPARDAGIKAGDVITAVNDRDVASPRELARLIAQIAPGSNVKVTLWRGGAQETVDVALGQLPGDEKRADSQVPAPAAANTTLEDFGLTVTRADNGEGLVVTDVEPGSAAAERGIAAGDVIVAVNSVTVSSTDDVGRAVDEAAKAGRKAVLVQVSRDDANRFVALPIAG